jgi:hypothetical protein
MISFKSVGTMAGFFAVGSAVEDEEDSAKFTGSAGAGEGDETAAVDTDVLVQR